MWVWALRVREERPTDFRIFATSSYVFNPVSFSCLVVVVVVVLVEVL